MSRPRASEFTGHSRRLVVETAAPAEPTGLDTGHELGWSVPVERLVASRRPTPVALLPLILNGGAALVALVAALAAARGSRRRRLRTSPIAVTQVVHLPWHATERRPLSRAA